MQPASLEKQLSKLEKIPFAAINVGDVVGKGRFKRVHRGRYRGRDAVVLRYAKDTSRGFSPSRKAGGKPSAEKESEEERDKNYNELKILALLTKKGSEPCVPEIFGVCHEPHSTIIVQELASFGTLKSLIQNASMRTVATNLHRLQCCIQMSRSMAFLESERVVHADLSCRNVLIFKFDESPNSVIAKVSDFGLSVVLKEDTDSVVLRQPQATRWCPPETVAANKISHSADVWALGCTMWEMYADGAQPWPLRPKRADVANRLKDVAERGGAAEGGTDMSNDFPRASCCPPVVHGNILACVLADEDARPRFGLLAEIFERISEEGGDTDSQAQAPGPMVESGSTAAFVVERNDIEPKAFALPPKEQSNEPDTPQWRAFCAWAAVDETAAARMRALRVFPDADREMLLAAEGRLKRQSDQLSELKKDASHKQVNGQMPPYGSSQSVSNMGVSSAPLTPRTRAPYVHASPSAGSSPTRMDSARPAFQSAFGRWTLWYARGQDIQQREFQHENEAWETFKWTQKAGIPCSLRDPAGNEVASDAWKAATFVGTAAVAPDARNAWNGSGGSFVGAPPAKNFPTPPSYSAASFAGASPLRNNFSAPSCFVGAAPGSFAAPPSFSAPCSSAAPAPGPSRNAGGRGSAGSIPIYPGNPFDCTPPRRSVSPPVPLISPRRMGNNPVVVGAAATNVTPPRITDFQSLCSQAALEYARPCSQAAVSLVGGRTPTKMVPNATLQCGNIAVW